jgi:hypothetical protein
VSLEDRLAALGYPPRAAFDADARRLGAGSEEVAALARRGWVVAVDLSRDDADHAPALTRLLTPLGVIRADIDEALDGGEDPHVAVHRLIAGLDWITIDVEGRGPGDALVGVMPAEVWTRIAAEELHGDLREVEVDEDDDEDDDDEEEDDDEPSLVRIEPTPRHAWSHLERLLVDLGHPARRELDEESAILLEHYAGLVEEIAALARRGWALEFDAEADQDDDTYGGIIAQALAPLRLGDVSFADGVLTLGSGPVQVGEPEHDDDDWLDPDFVLATVHRIAAERGWITVSAESGMHDILVAIVPAGVWRRMVEAGLHGTLHAVGVVEEEDIGN